MTSLTWKIERLRNMSLREVVYRASKAGRALIEKSVWPLTGAPKPPQQIGVRKCLLPPSQQWRQPWLDRFELEEAAYLDVISGHLDIFTHTRLKIGNPPDWHRDPLTGTRAPEVFGRSIDYRDDRLVGDIKVLWEFNRHQYLVALASAYALTDEARYLNVIENHIDSWIESNPVNVGINWCSSLELALRMISWCLVHSILMAKDSNRGLLEIIEPSRVGECLFHHARMIIHTLSRFSSANNHLIGELTGLWITLNTFDFGPIGDGWRHRVKSELEIQAMEQTFADGVNKEQAFYYHVSVLDFLLLSWVVGKRSGSAFSSDFESVIRSMAAFIRDVTPRGGAIPQVGDADDGYASRFTLGSISDPIRDVMTAVDRCLGTSSWAHDSVPGSKAFWYGIICDGIADNAPPDKARTITTNATFPAVYREGGYAVLGDERIHLLFDAGPLGYLSIAAHGHADALSICLALDGFPWLVDPGIYSYHSEHDWRDYFRGTTAHSTITVDSRNQSEIAGPFMWSRKANAQIEKHGLDDAECQYVEGSHDGYSDRGVDCRRTVRFNRDSKNIRITDVLSISRSVQLAVNFHFHPDVTVSDTARGTFSANRSGSGYNHIVIEPDARLDWSLHCGETDPKLGWYSSRLGELRPTTTLQGLLITDSDITIETRIDLHQRPT